MAAEIRPLASTSKSNASKRDARWPRSGELISRPDSADRKSLIPANGITCVALRRGGEVMALFRGCPHPSALASLKKLKIVIGIALSPDELRVIDQLDGYSYVFVAERHQAASTLKLAVTDLGRRNWSIDEATTWVAVSAGTQVFGGR